MVILITMAGASSRFINAGYAPKYTLELEPGVTMFDAALSSFSTWFEREQNDTKFIFVTNSADATIFVRSRLMQDMYHGMNYEILTLDGVTRGQAETAYFAIKDYAKQSRDDKFGIRDESEPLIIFNIDTIRHKLAEDLKEEFGLLLGHGYATKWKGIIDAFHSLSADESKWSFCKTSDPTLLNVTETAEKKKIGPWCSTGLYIFSDCTEYVNLYESIQMSGDVFNYYIAPMYNYMIDNGEPVFVMPCDWEDVDFAGVPSDYEAVKKKRIKNLPKEYK